MIYITQSYYAVPKMIRNNMTYLIVKQVSSMKNLTMIARECSLGLDKKQLTEIYKHATSEIPSFLLIDLEGDPKQRFRKNFNEFYDVEEE